MSKQEDKWQKYEGKNIPASLNLFPVIYDYIDKAHKIIDIGCGFGKTCVELYQKGFENLYGIDLSESGIDLAKKELSKLGLTEPERSFKVANAQKIPFEDGSFDFAISQAFWTSIVADERKGIMQEVSRILKKGGYYYIAEFAQTWRLPLYKQRYEDGIKKGYEKGTFESIDKKTGKLKYLAHHYTKDELDELLNSVGFKIVHYTKEIFTTQSGNKVDGHVLVAQK